MRSLIVPAIASLIIFATERALGLAPWTATLGAGLVLAFRLNVTALWTGAATIFLFALAVGSNDVIVDPRTVVRWCHLIPGAVALAVARRALNPVLTAFAVTHKSTMLPWLRRALFLALAFMIANAALHRLEQPMYFAAAFFVIAALLLRVPRTPVHREPIPTRERIGNWATLLVASVVALIILEFAVRLLPPLPHMRYSPVQQPYPILRFWNRANAIDTRETLHGYYTIATSEQRLRDRYYGPKPPGAVRIASLGDSFAIGYGVENELSYAKQLERMLNDAPDLPQVEVLNFGVTGYGPWQAARLLERAVMPFEPDAVIFQIYTGNDLYNELAQYGLFLEARPAGWSSLMLHQMHYEPSPFSQWMFPRSRLYYRVRRTWLNYLEGHTIRRCWQPAPWADAPTAGRDRPVWAEAAIVPQYPMLERAWAELEASVRRARDFCEQHDLPFVVLHIPDEYSLYPVHDATWADRFHLPPGQSYDLTLPHRRVRDICERNDIDHIMLRPIFQTAIANTAEPLYIPADRHLSAYGNWLTATQVTHWFTCSELGDRKRVN